MPSDDIGESSMASTPGVKATQFDSLLMIKEEYFSFFQETCGWSE